MLFVLHINAGTEVPPLQEIDLPVLCLRHHLLLYKSKCMVAMQLFLYDVFVSKF